MTSPLPSIPSNSKDALISGDTLGDVSKELETEDQSSLKARWKVSVNALQGQSRPTLQIRLMAEL